MNNYIRVKGWDEFQHYKDRTPPWIKLHNQLLEDYEFECLPDASKAHLLCIWLLASRTDNKINPDPKWISRKIGANTKVDIDRLLSSGFLELIQELPSVEQDASKVLQMPEQSACLEREERRVEGEGKKSKKGVSQKLDFSSWPSIPDDQVFRDWKSLRTKLKAPVSQTVINRLAKQLIAAAALGYSVDDCLAECTVRGWRGFEAEWLKKTPAANQPQQQLISGNPYEN